MSCNKKTKLTCGESTYSTCVDFEGTPNSQSTLTDCLDQEQVDQDQYNQLENIWSEIDLQQLGDRCLDYVETEEGKIVVKNVLNKFEEEICNLKEQINTLQNSALCDTDITNCGIDFNCLQTQCGNEIQTLKDWIITITNRICD